MTEVGVAAAVALALVVSPAWRVSRGWVTLAHELGHALTAIATEGRVRRIRIQLDTSGLTEWSGAGAARRIPRGVVAWWGHPAPGALAAALAAGLAAGHAVLAAQVLAGVVGVVALV
ncbi:MAG: M50 family metallopeptidase, partial [Iamia sp.]